MDFTGILPPAVRGAAAAVVVHSYPTLAAIQNPLLDLRTPTPAM
jgi:hypothetical protein